MTELTTDELMEIVMNAEPNGTYDQMEHDLRAHGYDELANKLLKMQQDAGLEMDPSFDPVNPDVTPGTYAARLVEAYEPLTKERYHGLMQDIQTTLTAHTPSHPPLEP